MSVDVEALRALVRRLRYHSYAVETLYGRREATVDPLQVAAEIEALLGPTPRRREFKCLGSNCETLHVVDVDKSEVAFKCPSCGSQLFVSLAYVEVQLGEPQPCMLMRDFPDGFLKKDESSSK